MRDKGVGRARAREKERERERERLLGGVLDPSKKLVELRGCRFGDTLATMCERACTKRIICFEVQQRGVGSSPPMLGHECPAAVSP